MLVLRDCRLKCGVDVLQAMLQDVAKAHQRRQVDAAQLQMVDQLLQVDRSGRILGGVNLDVSVFADGEVALAPALDLVQFGGVRNRPGVAYFVRRTGSFNGNSHESQ